MGDFADDAIDAGFAEWGGIEGRPYGLDIDEDGPGFISFRGRRAPQPKTCNRCGATGLVWQQTEAGWRLHEVSSEEDGFDLVEHRCEPNALAASS